MDLPRRSTIASTDGLGAAFGSACWRPWSQWTRPTRRSSTARRPRLTALQAAGKGALAQAIGRSRGGRTTKIHAVVDCLGRLIAFEVTPGQLGDVRVAGSLSGPCRRLLCASPTQPTIALGCATWAAMSQVVMNGPSPLTLGERELILAYAWDIRRGLLEEKPKDPATAAIEPKRKAAEKSFDAPGEDSRRGLITSCGLPLTGRASLGLLGIRSPPLCLGRTRPIFPPWKGRSEP
jgi:hypothetical protein